MVIDALHVLALVIGYLLCFLVGALGLLVLRDIYDGRIDLTQLLSEPSGDASMSRFQFFVFTFVIALSFFLVVAANIASNNPSFPVIPGTVLTLLGISGSSYLVSKGIQYSDPAGLVAQSTPDIVVSPPKATVGYKKTQQFTAQVARKPDAAVTWQVVAGPGTIDNTGLYTAPDERPAAWPEGSNVHATVQASTDAFPNATDVAVVTVI